MMSRNRVKDSLELFLESIKDFPPLTRQEAAYYNRRKKTDPTAFEILCLANLKLLPFAAKTLVGRGLDLEDLIQEGYFGLRRAVELYDHRKAGMSTYCMYWIRQSMLRAIKAYRTTGHMPEYVQENLVKLLTMLEMYDKQGKEPHWDAISKVLRTPSSRLREDLKKYLFTASIDGVDHNGKANHDSLSDNNDPSEHAENDDYREWLRDILTTAFDKLPERDAYILVAHNLYDPPLTLDAIGHELHISKGRVWQIEMRAIKKARDLLKPVERLIE